nr:MAG TPA: hypothetical protein [Caudoviricetes sp.]
MSSGQIKNLSTLYHPEAIASIVHRRNPVFILLHSNCSQVVSREVFCHE